MCPKDKENILKCLFIVLLLIIIIIPLSIMPEQKNILTTVATNENNPNIGTTNIKFGQNDIIIGSAMSHEVNSDEIKINESGIYQISYQVYGKTEKLGSFKFNAILSVNNNFLEDTFNESPILKQNTENRMTLSGTVIIKLNAGDILRLQAVTIEDITFQRARIDIEKIA